MTAHDGPGAEEEGPAHDAVGAYALGVLDNADAAAFEEHLAGCELCAVRLDEFSAMEPLLALLVDGPDGRSVQETSDAPAAGRAPAPRLAPRPAPTAGLGSAPTAGPDGRGRADTADADEPAVPVRPGPQLLDRLVDEVAARRAKRRRRGRCLAAAAVVLIVGGPVAAVEATSGDRASTTHQAAGAYSESAYFKSLTTRYSATDATTGVSATIAVEGEPWGTNAVLELRNVRGPLKCRLVAVAKSGEQQTVTSWAVPGQGYGVPGSPHPAVRRPLYVRGGTAVQPKDIDHFDVTTFDGRRLVRVPA